MKQRIATIVGAIGIIAVGVVLYEQTAADVAACTSTIGGLVRALDPASARDCANANVEHDGGIAIFIVGALALLIGLVWGKRR